MILTEVFVGVDVSKNTLDVHIHPVGEFFQVKNSNDGLKKLILAISKYNVKIVACESSGGYENLLYKKVSDVWRIDPRQVKSFIRSEGIKAKTDPIDAKMIALFASQKQRKYVSPKFSEKHDLFKALIKRKFEIRNFIMIEKKRLRHPKQVHCKKTFTKHITFLEKQIDSINNDINVMIDNNIEWKNKIQILESVPGINRGTSSVLIATLPEIGTVSDKQISALVGVAPYTQQSGTYNGIASISGGRQIPRQALYMASLSVTQYNLKLKTFYKRLIDSGKKPKIALVAVMRKLIGILNVMVKYNRMWDNDFK